MGKEWPTLEDEDEQKKEDIVIKPPSGNIPFQSWIGPYKGLSQILSQMGATDLKNAVDQKRWELQQEEIQKKEKK